MTASTQVCTEPLRSCIVWAMKTKLQERLAPLRGKWRKVADVAGVAPMTIYRICWGVGHDHKFSTYQRISAAIDVVSLERQAQ